MDRDNTYMRVYDITDKGFVHFVRKVQVKSRVECTRCFAVFPKLFIQRHGDEVRCMRRANASISKELIYDCATC